MSLENLLGRRKLNQGKLKELGNSSSQFVARGTSHSFNREPGQFIPCLIYNEEEKAFYNLSGTKMLELEEGKEGTYKIISRISPEYLKEITDIKIDKTTKNFIDMNTALPAFEFEYLNYLLEKEEKQTNMIDELIKSGFHEGHAEFIAQRLEVESGKPVSENTKNQVYFLKDIYGNKKVIKFVESKKEAEIEVAVNKRFAEHPILKQYVPGTDQDTPIAIEINGETKYAVIQNDITNKSFPELEKAMFSNKNNAYKYTEYWMRALANIHHYGSEVMSELGLMTPAETLSAMPKREKDLMRLEDCKYTKNNMSQIKDLVEEVTTYQKSFIHFDAKPENRIGLKFIDWGNAGWGSQYLDISTILNDTRIHLTRDEKMYFVSLYVQQLNELIIREKSNAPLLNEESAIKEYEKIEYLINSTFTAYYDSKNDLRADENQRKELLIETNKNSIINKENKTHIMQNVKTIDTPTTQETYLPDVNTFLR